MITQTLQALMLCAIASVLTGCAITEEQRIDEAYEFCGFRGYKYLKVYRAYGEIDAIYCSLGEGIREEPFTNPLANPDVPHE